jgi:hypothetical protein
VFFSLHYWVGGIASTGRWGYPAEFTDGLSKIYDELVQLQDERNANIAASKTATVKQQQLLQ